MTHRLRVAVGWVMLAAMACTPLLGQDRTPLRVDGDEKRIEPEGLELESDVLELAVPYTTAEGKTAILNNSGRTIVAIRGSYDFQPPGGDVKVVPWTHYLADPMATGEMGLKPDASQVLPPTRDPDGNLVPYLNLKVTGFICADGSGAGRDAAYLRRINRARTKTRIYQVLQTMKLLEERGEDEFFQMLTHEDAFVTGSRSWLFHRVIGGILLNEDRTALKEGCEEILEAQLNKLEAL